MDNSPLVQTALCNTTVINGLQHTLEALSLVGKINLRGDANDKNFAQCVESILELTLPLVANTFARSGSLKLFWLGPDEWLLHLPLKQMGLVLAKLREKLSGLPHALVDVSDYYSVISLSGKLSCDILATAMPFDLRAQNFAVGSCTQSRFGHASVLLWPEDEKPTFCLQVRWSYAQYVYEYLTQSLSNVENLKTFESSQAG